MKQSRFTDSQIIDALKRAEAGLTVSVQEKAYLATLDILEKTFLARPRVVMNYWD